MSCYSLFFSLAILFRWRKHWVLLCHYFFMLLYSLVGIKCMREPEPVAFFVFIAKAVNDIHRKKTINLQKNHNIEQRFYFVFYSCALDSLSTGFYDFFSIVHIWHTVFFRKKKNSCSVGVNFSQNTLAFFSLFRFAGQLRVSLFFWSKKCLNLKPVKSLKKNQHNEILIKSCRPFWIISTSLVIYDLSRRWSYRHLIYIFWVPPTTGFNYMVYKYLQLKAICCRKKHIRPKRMIKWQGFEGFMAFLQFYLDEWWIFL